MNGFRRCCHFSLFWVLIYTNAVLAAEATTIAELKSLCAIAKAQGADAAAVVLLQHEFDGGVQDVAMAVSNEYGLDIKRVTFGGSAVPECHYNAMALARGGDWGWHLAWLAKGSSILRYARMDGEAWVSSPAKKLSAHAHPAAAPLILTSGQQVWIAWYETGAVNSIYAVLSDDEGRSWNEAKLIAETAKPLAGLRLMMKENKPYLVGQGIADGVPLP